jgi:hypothetical protein
VTHKLDATEREQYLCPTCKRPARAMYDGTERWREDRERWYAEHPETRPGRDPEPAHDVLRDDPGAAGEVVRDGANDPGAGTPDASERDERMSGDGEPVPTAGPVVTACKPEPVIFPAPRDAVTADMIEATAENLLADYPYRTLLDCRELAARLVDEVLAWDAMWPEAEGDCSCPDGLTEHRAECIWTGTL